MGVICMPGLGVRTVAPQAMSSFLYPCLLGDLPALDSERLWVPRLFFSSHLTAAVHHTQDAVRPYTLVAKP